MSALAAAVAAASLAFSPPHLLAAPKCPLFPADNPWNQRVDALPVASNSATIIQSIGGGTGLHADFGSGTYAGSLIGIPFNVVPGTQPKRRIARFEYANREAEAAQAMKHVKPGKTCTDDDGIESLLCFGHGSLRA